ncbi:MAG: hypothetical protein J7515_08015 [Caulobacter sp.]|nr:hypothetical protein [Caulobacter sp.]
MIATLITDCRATAKAISGSSVPWRRATMSISSRTSLVRESRARSARTVPPNAKATTRPSTTSIAK